MMNKRFIVTGGAGFIGSALVRHLVRDLGATVLVVDKLTYAGVPESLRDVGLDPSTLASSEPRLFFRKADVCDKEAMPTLNNLYNELLRQVVDLALLGNGMLKGKALSDFIARSEKLLQ